MTPHVPKYTMSTTSSMNDIAERRNQTLQDMVRSMMAESSLHIRCVCYGVRL